MRYMYILLSCPFNIPTPPIPAPNAVFQHDDPEEPLLFLLISLYQPAKMDVFVCCTANHPSPSILPNNLAAPSGGPRC